MPAKQRVPTAWIAEVKPRTGAELARPLLRTGACELHAGAPTVTYEYDTRPWLLQLQKSFGSKERAQRQCELDWPRMAVHDLRSFLMRLSEYVQPSDAQTYFANQATFARPYALLVKAYSNSLVTQDSHSRPALTLRPDGTLQLAKTFIVWATHTGDASPVFDFTVHALIDIGPARCSVTFKPQAHDTGALKVNSE